MNFDYMQTLTFQPPYEVRFIKEYERPYVSECWHASRAYGQSRVERLAYVVRQFVRKYPQYESRRGGVYKDVCGILECV
jgi:hypothetical protein